MLDLNFEGIILGFVTFLCIGIFHPLVIKCEYYFGTKCWWAFLLMGIIGCLFSLWIENTYISVFFGIVAFSSFWSIKEIFQQRERVRKGWFPKNPKRDDY